MDITNFKDADHEAFLDASNPDRYLYPGLLEVATIDTEEGLRIIQIWESKEKAVACSQTAPAVLKGLGAGEVTYTGFDVLHVYRQY